MRTRAIDFYVLFKGGTFAKTTVMLSGDEVSTEIDHDRAATQDEATARAKLMITDDNVEVVCLCNLYAVEESEPETGTPWDRYMNLLGNSWGNDFDRLSKAEGWALFDTGTHFQIQAIDDPEEGDASLPGQDGEAYSVCVKKALAGSRMHLLALFLDGRSNKGDVWVPGELLRVDARVGIPKPPQRYEHYYHLNCPSCQHRLTTQQSVEITYTNGDQSWNALSHLDRDGLLVDPDGGIAAGYHSHAECEQCGVPLVEKVEF